MESKKLIGKNIAKKLIGMEENLRDDMQKYL